MFIRKILFLLFPLFLFGAVVADTVYLENDAWDAYVKVSDLSEVIDDDEVQVGITGFSYDGYWAFSVTSDIYNRTIDSVKIVLYVNSIGLGGDFDCYGIQLEDCGEIESIDLSSTTKTSASVSMSEPNSTGEWTSDDINNVFAEWVSDYTHSGTDHFGLAFMEDGNYLFKSYDYSHTSYDENTFLIFYYIGEEPSGQIIIIKTR